MLHKLRLFQKELSILRKDLASVKGDRIAKKSIREAAERLGSKWFSEFSEVLAGQYGIGPELIESYSRHFGKLIKVSAPNNLKKSYNEALRAILKSFRNDFVISLQIRPQNKVHVSLLAEVLKDLPPTGENDYLREAIECATHGFYRAAIVLGWCAAIDRVHRTIEKIGFARFNITSATMASQTSGRFKRFSSVQNVTSLNDLREVFDTNILWIIEGMALIDSNQHTRIRSCFDIRCQCAHPGDAPVTQYNLLSYFSDLNEIIFKNSGFATS